MNTITFKLAISAMLVATVTLSGTTYAQEGSVLDPSQHPSLPSYEPGLSGKILPLDARLSWTKRFKGNEEFNENEMLTQTTNMPLGNSMDHSGHSMSGDGMKMDAMGMIKQVKTDQAKIKIKHGPIERLGMPAMTMLFKVNNVSLLENLKKGQEVGFSVENSSGGFVVTDIMPMSDDTERVMEMSATAGDMDAQGTVKTIRAAQGKIKIEHGPIERLGMPAMTMVFKVKDAALLEGIEKGGTVDFSVDNSSGGFVITNIKPAN